MDGTAQAAETPTKQYVALYAAIAAALPTAAAFACGWLYQYGRATYFKIPLGLIRVQISDICLALSVLILCALGSWLVFVLGKAAEVRDRFVTALWTYALFITTFLFAISLGGLEERTLSPALLTSALTAFVLAILLTTKELRTKIAGHPRWAPSLIATSVLLALTFGNFGLGWVRALTQSYFYVEKSRSPAEPPLVVLALYDDWLVLSPLESDNHTLKPRIIVRSLSKNETTTERVHFPKRLVAGDATKVAKLRDSERSPHITGGGG